MRRVFLAFGTAFAVMLAPYLVRAQDCLMTGSESSATSAGDAASTNAESTGNFFVSPIVSTESGIASSSEWTTAALAASVTQVGFIMLFVLLGIGLLVALGWGIYLTVKSVAADETAFRRFLRYNRHALEQQVVAGHGPVLVDFGVLFGVHDAYATFAAVMRRDERWLRAHFGADVVESAEVNVVGREIALRLLREPAIVADWAANGRLGLWVGPASAVSSHAVPRGTVGR